jgi:hypothetical protein
MSLDTPKPVGCDDSVDGCGGAQLARRLARETMTAPATTPDRRVMRHGEAEREIGVGMDASWSTETWKVQAALSIARSHDASRRDITNPHAARGNG